MRLIAEDAGGLVDCAHCGLELIAPDPAIGRGARLSRASEGKLGSIGRVAPAGDQRLPSDPHEDSVGVFETGGDDDTDLDPNHSLARQESAAPAERIRAVKALDPERLGRAFRRQEVIADQVFGSSDNDWEPLAAARRTFGESRQDKNGFWIALSIAVGVMVGIVILVVREASRSGEVFDGQQLVEIQAAQKQRSSRFQGSFAVAQEALASPDWEGLLPYVRDPERVEPLMREYYSELPYKPTELTGFHAPVVVSVGELSLHEMKVTDSSGRVGMLVVEDRKEGPKLDWELSFNFAGFSWKRFLETRPAEAQTVRVVASRSSLLDRYFEDAGIERDEAIGIRLWQDSVASYYATLPKDSELAKTMTELLEWDKGRKLIIRASSDPASQLDDRVRIDGFVQTGWVIE